VFIADNLGLEKRDVVSVRVRKMFHRTSKEKDTVDRVKQRERKKNLKKGTRNAVVYAADTILAPPKT